VSSAPPPPARSADGQPARSADGQLATDHGVARDAQLRVGPVTRSQIVRFAGAGGDFNPMHHDEPFAQAAGQPSVFAMGQLSAALLARLAADWLGPGNLRELSVRFTAKVWPGDELALAGSVVDEFEADGEPRWRCELTATRPGGEMAARGLAVARSGTRFGGC
jgi:acyl dehydratase